MFCYIVVPMSFFTVVSMSAYATAGGYTIHDDIIKVQSLCLPYYSSPAECSEKCYDRAEERCERDRDISVPSYTKCRRDKFNDCISDCCHQR
jgi:hypothetical protein